MSRDRDWQWEVEVDRRGRMGVGLAELDGRAAHANRPRALRGGLLVKARYSPEYTGPLSHSGAVDAALGAEEHEVVPTTVVDMLHCSHSHQS